MATLKDLINLAKADGGKFFVLGEDGEAKLVIMSVEEYQRLLLGKLQRQVEDVEKINQEIIREQLKDQPEGNQDSLVRPLPLRQQSGHSPHAWGGQKARSIPRVDLREEVIDPSFDFEGPRIEFNDL